MSKGNTIGVAIGAIILAVFLMAVTEAEAISYCNCCYDKLLALYPDLSTNEERMNRIIASGYNQTETDTVVKCLPESAKE